MKIRTLIVPAGRFNHPRGIQVLDRAALTRILSTARKSTRAIPVDFEHRTPAIPLAGSVDPATLTLTLEGIFGELTLTPRAAERAEKELLYLSPLFLFNPLLSRAGGLFIQKVIGLGLTPAPNIPVMPPVINPVSREERMEEFLEKLRELLGLPEGAELEAISAALFKKLSAPEPEAPEQAADPAPAKADETAALKQELEAMKEKERQTAVETALREGRLLPAQKDWALAYLKSDPEGFKSFLANSRPVQMGGLVEDDAAPAGRLDETQEKINGLLGISGEVHFRFNQ